MTVYMDHAATSFVKEEALQAMLPYLREQFGNPSSLHGEGLAAKRAMQTAREQLSVILGCSMNELYFTSGGTEADNWAIKGYLQASPEKGRHIITSAIEHPAVLRTCEFLQRNGYSLTVLPVDGNGIVTPESVRAAIRPDTALISIQYANNEIGTIEPIAEIGSIAEERGIAFHTDAVQAVGQLPIKLSELPVTTLSASGHKFGGPKGVGFLYVHSGTKLEPLLHGGPQEKRRRAGTENVPSIIAMSKALSLSEAVDWDRIRRLRDEMETRLKEKIPDILVNGHPTSRLPGSLSVSIKGVEATSVLVYLDLAGIAASGGSACSSAENKPSAVLSAIGVTEPYLSGTVRFTLGEDNTMQEVEYVVDTLAETVKKLRRY